jgi:hypothetical protein
MNPFIQKLIEENIDYIEAENFDVVYDKAMSSSHMLNIGELTDIFYDAGIDPLASLTEIPSLFLDESKITALVVPENIKRIRKCGFAFSNLNHIELHKDCELSESCFYGSKIDSIVIPYIMSEVPDECFYGCSWLSEANLNAVEQIGVEAFSHCKNLKQLFIPDDINFIADSAFYECPVVLLFHSDNEYAIEYCERTKTEYKFV